MSGILDKKSRIIDFVITRNGREQIESGDIRYKFASLSDKSIVYTKDHDLSKINKSDISKSEIDFLPLEVLSKENDSINPEFDIAKFYSTEGVELKRITENDSILVNTRANEHLQKQTLTGYLTNFKLIKTKNVYNEDKSFSFVEKAANNIDIVLTNNDLDQNISSILKYSTIKHKTVRKKNVPVIALDKRFSHKNNFLYLPPKDVSGIDLYDKEDFKNIDDLDEENSTGFLLSSYNGILDENIESREKEILKIVKSMEKNEGLYKRVYEIESPTDNDSLIFELHELDVKQEASENLKEIVDFKKLHFVKIGDFYDKESMIDKKIYLIGKVFNTREDSDDLDTNFIFNNGKINLQSQSEFALSSYFSFICLFTLIVE